MVSSALPATARTRGLPVTARACRGGKSEKISLTFPVHILVCSKLQITGTGYSFLLVVVLWFTFQMVAIPTKKKGAVTMGAALYTVTML